MALDGDAEAAGETVDRSLEARVVERDELTALLADQMMVMVAAGMRALEARLSLSHLETLKEAVLQQQIEYAVDRGATGGPTLHPEGVFDLGCAERARLRGQKADHPIACLASLQARPSENQPYMFAPVDGHGVR